MSTIEVADAIVKLLNDNKVVMYPQNDEKFQGSFLRKADGTFDPSVFSTCIPYPSTDLKMSVEQRCLA